MLCFLCLILVREIISKSDFLTHCNYKYIYKMYRNVQKSGALYACVRMMQSVIKHNFHNYAF